MTDPGLLPWLRDAITGRLELAREAADGDSGEWFTGRKWNVYRAEDEARYDEDYQGEENRLVVYGNVKPQSEYIAANDPRDTIARCEAELAILDEHGPYDDGGRDLYCQICGDVPQVPWPCRTVSLLAAGYRHHPGWKAEWAA